ncbi:MAG TPA: RNA chaperone Hfq [Nitrospirota bacterium]
MEPNLLDRMLTAYLEAKTPVTITLQNKIRISGKIRAFDSYVIIMEGHKREIVYRHAISSLSPNVLEDRKRPVASQRPASDRTHQPARTRPASPKPVAARPQDRPQARPQALAASAGDPGLNNSMKEGLLKWMQEQKAAK